MSAALRCVNIIRCHAASTSANGLAGAAAAGARPGSAPIAAGGRQPAQSARPYYAPTAAWAAEYKEQQPSVQVPMAPPQRALKSEETRLYVKHMRHVWKALERDADVRAQRADGTLHRAHSMTAIEAAGGVLAHHRALSRTSARPLEPYMHNRGVMSLRSTLEGVKERKAPAVPALPGGAAADPLSPSRPRRMSAAVETDPRARTPGGGDPRAAAQAQARTRAQSVAHAGARDRAGSGSARASPRYFAGDASATEAAARVPAPGSRGHPLDVVGGETRDTIPEVLDLVCAHPDVDAVIHLGIGIQAATAGMFRSGSFFPEHGLERMSGFHERQDRRYAEAGIEASQRHGKPVLAVTELAASNPENPAPAALREQGRLCYPSAHRAVRALGALVRWAEFKATQDA